MPKSKAGHPVQKPGQSPMHPKLLVISFITGDSSGMPITHHILLLESEYHVIYIICHPSLT
jgi:hypothetical protein